VASLCEDTVFCNGLEVCNPTAIGHNPTTGCVAGTPPTCSDGVACTEDVCNIALDRCVSAPDNSLCPCGETCNPASGGCANTCHVTWCGNHLWNCGDCLDNDGDCRIDDADPMCLGPCDNTENSLYPDMHQPSNCGAECYYDSDSGGGNDGCTWDYGCDPFSVSPNYNPTNNKVCSYVKRDVASCDLWWSTQSDMCLGIGVPSTQWSCAGVTPNGCDCFGCCDIPIPSNPTQIVTVWLGSNDGAPDCTLDEADLNNPSICRPCTRVPSCGNSCEHCEICLGKPELPADCTCQECGTAQMCGPPCGTPCPTGYFCNTGCCALNPS
jgi:hypothetical protein